MAEALSIQQAFDELYESVASCPCFQALISYPPRAETSQMALQYPELGVRLRRAMASNAFGESSLEVQVVLLHAPEKTKNTGTPVT